ncbi:glycoside hydrolase family 127 protein [Microbacterium karelineae]|uniref:glycoside hydrolase family 127 protein n=1 Tax=Microbacterium karelineae TaxID=2654283 RepID=UPI0027D29369|nr:beta-L-arabinofuranosidase domain-containing protein [Microbacterium karelineae]
MTLDTTRADPLARPVVAPGSRRGIGLGEMRLVGGFWGGLQETNARATLRHCHDWMERLGWLANFDRVARGATGGERPGWQFSDSEVYKLLEAVAWQLGHTPDPAAERLWGELVGRIASAQDDDGYLNTCFGHDGQAGRYSDLSAGHELYCTGHLLQVAVARVRTHGEDDELVRIARRAADHVCREFGVDGRQGICGHPEIELGLVELGRALDEPAYIEQARLFIERRGRGSLAPIALLSPAYFQDDVPVREADRWRGHAVRALYLAAGALDVATETGDGELFAAVERQWTRSVERRTYLTGGMGSRHQDEGFGDDWELPPDRAYCETCAGVASIMVSWRLLLATGDAKYADLIERTMFNVVATSPRADGRAFFYANPLHQREPGGDVRPDAVNPRAEGGIRAPWFDVSCCPTNVARTLASWQSCAAFVDEEGEAPVVTIAQYAAGEMRVATDGGPLVLEIETAYPAEGAVRIRVREASADPVSLRLRVPHWATGATLRGPGGAARECAPGWADVAAPLVAGDEIVLDLPVAPRLTWPDPRIDAARGTVAVERGPLVLCLESVDLPDGAAIDGIALDTGQAPRGSGDGAIVRVRASTPHAGSAGRPPFLERPDHPGGTAHEVEVPLIPYHRWAERGPSTMRVLLPMA